MSVVLLGWELGGGLGHASKLLDVARGLSARGHQPVLAFKDVSVARFLGGEIPFPIVPAPRFSGVSPPAFRASDYGQILGIRGYGDVDSLRLLVDAWQRLLELTRAELVVADFAPTLCLAAYGEVPTVVAGSGFAVPPMCAHEFPRLGPGIGAVVSSDQILENVRDVQRQRGRRVPESLPAMLEGSARFVRTIEELDPYVGMRGGEDVSLWNVPGPMSRCPEGTRFFAYLNGEYAGYERVFSSLAAAGFEGAAYVRGAGAGLREAARRVGIRMYETAPPLERVIDDSAVVIHHGGLSTAVSALVAGRPQLTLSLHLEQALTGRALERLGVGRSFRAAASTESVLAGLRELMADRRYRDEAVSFAERFEARRETGGLSRVIDACEALVS